MNFSPSNPIAKRCLQAMSQEEKGQPEAASQTFLQAWNEATNDFEKFIAAFFVARHQKDVSDKLKWLETALQLALQVNDDAVKPAFPILYANMAKCCEDLHDPENAKKNHSLADSSTAEPSDNGPFYHGTRAAFQTGDFLIAGFGSNYQSELVMNHIYFTALPNGAGLAASLAKGDGPERVYIVEPTGRFENDPNVTNKKFPGNPTRSYRTEAPLKIIGELTGWARQTPAERHQWLEKLAKSKGEIIN